MHIRKLTASDVPEYRALMIDALEQEPDAFTSTPEERAREPEGWWVRRVGEPAGLSVTFGAIQGELELVGAVTLEFSARKKTRHKAHLIGMYVRPAWRGIGLARRLIEAAIATCRARGGIRALQLTVREGNEPAIALYRRVGFVPFGVEPMAICTPAGFSSMFHMWLELPD